VPAFRSTFRTGPDPGERFLGLDVPGDAGVAGECLVTLDRGVWEAMGSPDGYTVEVTLTPLTDAPAPAAAEATRNPPA
jgi:hypothetical protein